MSYAGSAKSTDEVCFPRHAVLRMLPRAAGPIRYLTTTSGPAWGAPILPGRGILVIDPRFDRLP
jgi:hypothetical protein